MNPKFLCPNSTGDDSEQRACWKVETEKKGHHNQAVPSIMAFSNFISFTLFSLLTTNKCI